MQLPASLPEPPDLEPYDREWDDEDAHEPFVDRRREEIEDVLADGAWERALHEWAEHADWDEADFETVLDLGLFEEFDFYWDPDCECIEYHGPEIPDDWQEREAYSALDSHTSVSKIEMGLADLGRVVSEILQSEYLDWESPFPDPDAPIEDVDDGAGLGGEPEPESELIHDPYARESENGEDVIDENEFESPSDHGSWS